MLITLIAFILWAPAILGIGSLGHIPYQKFIDKTEKGSIIENAILGLAIISAIANLLNFFTAISVVIQAIILLVGWGQFFHVMYTRKREYPKILIFGALAWGLTLIFFRVHGTPAYYDSGYYGLQNLQWYNTTPLPLGLANLHSRFAYNSSWLGLASVVQYPSIDYFVSGEILLWFVGFIGLHAIQESIQKQWSASTVYGLSISLVLLTPALGTFTSSSLATDLPVFWLCIILGWTGLRLLEHKISPIYSLWFIAITVFFGITVKLSAFPILLVLISIIIIVRNDVIQSFASLSKAIAPLAGLLFIPWLVRFFWMSGCLVYPLSFTCSSSVQWAVTSKSAQWMTDYIKQFAIDRTLLPKEIYSPWFIDKLLFQKWLDLYFTYSETLTVLFFFVLSLALYFASIKKTPANRNHAHEIILLLPYIAGIIFWFFTAPDIRFGAGYFWVVILLLLSLGFFYLLQGVTLRLQNLAFAFMQASLIGMMLVSFARIGSGTFQWPFSTNWISPALPPVAESYYQIIDNVTVRYPVKSDLLCWGEPLPCTPELNPNLRILKNTSGHIIMFYLSPDN